MHCSAAAPCKGLKFNDVDIRPKAGGHWEGSVLEYQGPGGYGACMYGDVSGGLASAVEGKSVSLSGIGGSSDLVLY